MNSRKIRDGRWVQHVERVDGHRMTSLRFQHDDGSFADEAPQPELVTELIDMGDGTHALAPAWRVPEPEISAETEDQPDA